MMLLSSVSRATAAELLASLLVRYRLVAINMHSNAPDKMMRRERMVRRDITLYFIAAGKIIVVLSPAPSRS